MLPVQSFIFGKDFSPVWFNRLVKEGRVEWINEYGRVKGCYCVNKTGVTLAVMIGEIIKAEDFFKTEEELKEYCKGEEEK